MIQFYAPGLPDDLRLPESEASHCLRVLRMTVGDEITCVDGRGNRYLCRLLDSNPRRCTVEILSQERVERYWPADLVVAVAPTKHLDRMEWLVEKLTEVGVDRLIPLLCDRSERREIKTERLEKIAVSAMKQSLKATLPTISPMTRLRDVVKEFGEDSPMQRFIAYCDPTIPRRDYVKLLEPSKPMVILIGPEGDFSPGEIETTLSAGYQPVTLGAMRLRTETAALYAIMAAHAVADR